jgi:hypothetical protein
VIGDAVSIVHLDDDLVVVHKPPSVPVSCHSSLMMFVVVVILLVVIVVDWQIPKNNPSLVASLSSFIPHDEKKKDKNPHSSPCSPIFILFLESKRKNLILST